MNLLQYLLFFLFGWGQNNGGGGGGGGGGGAGNGKGNGNGGNNNNNENPPSPTATGSDDLVAILGGGISGIAAARELENAGANWMLFEATDRLGGRLYTRYIGEGTAGCPGDKGCPVEIGQRYIQGIQRNPLWDLAQSLNFRSHQVNYNKVEVYDKIGDLVKKPPFVEWDKAFVCAEEAGLELNAGSPPFDALDGRALLDACGWDPPNDPSEVKDAIEWFDMEFEYGREPEQFGAYAFPELTYMDFRPFDHYGSDIDGFEKITNFLKEDLPLDKISLSTKVTEVRDESDEVKITVEDADGNIKIINARYAISSIPFGVIKEDKTLLFPNLPGEWLGVVDEFIMGGYHSSYLQFTNKFWQNTEFLLTARSGRDTPETDDPVIGFKPHDTGHPVNYWPDSNILQANAGGDAADYFDGLCKTNQALLKEIILDRLNSMYPDEDLVMDDIIDFDCSSWSADDNVKGAWFQFGNEATPDDYETLHERQGNLLFSGESSCRRYYGFGHGALLAGWRDANIVLDELGFDAILEDRCEALPENQGNAVPRSRRFRG